MARSPRPPAGPRPIETLVHADTRRNIPTAEFQPVSQQMEGVAPLLTRGTGCRGSSITSIFCSRPRSPRLG